MNKKVLSTNIDLLLKVARFFFLETVERIYQLNTDVFIAYYFFSTINSPMTGTFETTIFRLIITRVRNKQELFSMIHSYIKLLLGSQIIGNRGEGN